MLAFLFYYTNVSYVVPVPVYYELLRTTVCTVGGHGVVFAGGIRNLHELVRRTPVEGVCWNGN